MESPAYGHIDWFTSRGNIPNEASSNSAVSLPLDVRWDVDLDSEPTGNAYASVVGSQGRLFLGMDGAMFCINAITGDVLWSFAAEGWIGNPGAVVAFDKTAGPTVLFNTDRGNVYAVDGESGELVWEKQYPHVNLQRPTAALSIAAGRIYQMDTGADGHTVFRALDTSDGTELWTRTTPSLSANLKSFVHGFGSVFVAESPGEASGYFARLRDADGEVDWTFNAPYPDHSTGQNTWHHTKYSSGVLVTDVAPGEQPFVVFGHGHQPARVVALNVATGTEKWRRMLTHNGYVAGFSVTKNREENVLVVTTLNAVYRLHLGTGEIVWEYQFATLSKPARHSSPASPWGVWARPRRSPRWPSISPATSRGSPPAPR